MLFSYKIIKAHVYIVFSIVFEEALFPRICCIETFYLHYSYGLSQSKEDLISTGTILKSFIWIFQTVKHYITYT